MKFLKFPIQHIRQGKVAPEGQFALGSSCTEIKAPSSDEAKLPQKACPEASGNQFTDKADINEMFWWYQYPVP